MPPAVVTVIFAGTFVSVGGTTEVSWVEDWTEVAVPVALPKRTVALDVKFVPVIVTGMPIEIVDGEKPLMVGGGGGVWANSSVLQESTVQMRERSREREGRCMILG